MRYSAIVLGFFGLAIAEPSLMQRQVQTIVNVINNVDTQVKALDSAIQAFTSDPAPVLNAANAVLNATTQGATTVNSATSVSVTDALTIQSAVQTLTTDLNTTITDLIAKKSQAVSLGFGGEVEQNLQQQLTAAQGLATAIVSKVPSSLSGIAMQMSQGIINDINAGVAAFQGTGSASSSVASGTTATTSAAGMSVTNASTTPTVRASSASSVATTSAPAVFTGAANPIHPAQFVGGLALAAAVAAF